MFFKLTPIDECSPRELASNLVDHHFVTKQLGEILDAVGLPVVTNATIPVIAARAAAMGIEHISYWHFDAPGNIEAVFAMTKPANMRTYLAQYGEKWMTRDSVYADFGYEDDDAFVSAHTPCASFEEYLRRFVGCSVVGAWVSDKEWLRKYVAGNPKLTLQLRRESDNEVKAMSHS